MRFRNRVHELISLFQQTTEPVSQLQRCNLYDVDKTRIATFYSNERQLEDGRSCYFFN